LKKCIAILFLAVYLFNLVGHSMVIDYLINRNDSEAANRIDNGDFNPSQLVEIKVPIGIPYYSSSFQFERYYGAIDMDGRYYNYVMRKVHSDTVYLLCLPDHARAELAKAKAIAGSIAADVPDTGTPKKGNDPAAKKQMSMTEYCQQVTGFDFNAVCYNQEGAGSRRSAELSSCFIGTPFEPPRVI
jgi:hypothetical protein